MNRAEIHSSYRDDWATPWSLFERWDREFGFELDACATLESAKCPRFWSRDEDGLAQPWAPLTTWLNPPYGRDIALWLRKAWLESLKGTTVVTLIPANTDCGWFHELVWPLADELRIIRGRVSFDPPPGALGGRPAGGNLLAIYRRPMHRLDQPGPRVTTEARAAAGAGGK